MIFYRFLWVIKRNSTFCFLLPFPAHQDHYCTLTPKVSPRVLTLRWLKADVGALTSIQMLKAFLGLCLGTRGSYAK